jgi:TIR domain
MPHDVFISYATKDKRIADAACAAIEARGFRCWMAPRDVLPGMSHGEAITRAIQNCHVMVLVFSASANASTHICKEVERAVTRDLAVIPFRIEPVSHQGRSAFRAARLLHQLAALARCDRRAAQPPHRAAGGCGQADGRAADKRRGLSGRKPAAQARPFVVAQSGRSTLLWVPAATPGSEHGLFAFRCRGVVVALPPGDRLKYYRCAEAEELSITLSLIPRGLAQDIVRIAGTLQRDLSCVLPSRSCFNSKWA